MVGSTSIVRRGQHTLNYWDRETDEILDYQLGDNCNAALIMMYKYASKISIFTFQKIKNEHGKKLT